MRTDTNGETIVHNTLKLTSRFKTVYNCLAHKLNETQLKTLIVSEKSGKNLLHLAKNEESGGYKINPLWNLLTQYLQNETLKDLLLKKNLSNETGFEMLWRNMDVKNNEACNKLMKDYLDIFGCAKLQEIALGQDAERIFYSSTFHDSSINTDSDSYEIYCHTLRHSFDNSDDKNILKSFFCSKNQNDESPLMVFKNNRSIRSGLKLLLEVLEAQDQAMILMSIF